MIFGRFSSDHNSRNIKAKPLIIKNKTTNHVNHGINVSENHPNSGLTEMFAWYAYRNPDSRKRTQSIDIIIFKFVYMGG